MTNCEMLTACWLKDMQARAERGDAKAKEALERYSRPRCYYG